ncbi:hypothetical protein KJ781_03515 [Patescibacteria group bacterium]|nr:hypothetical protein [Patescibacteria group bacterium]MBU1448376.1 hypothetical protein [Patescibacteria group bacterium]MBU2613420.1 hypothetical protein [Patescibacteria group bacterium]
MSIICAPAYIERHFIIRNDAEGTWSAEASMSVKVYGQGMPDESGSR